MPGEVNEQSETFEREELVRALQARERFLTGVIGSLESFVTIDEDWRLTFANAAAERLTGLEHGDLLGRDIRDLAHAPALVQALPLLEQALREKVVVEFDASDEGRAAVFHVRVYPLADGGLALYAGDVTERVRTERARRESEQALAESEERYRQLFRAESDALQLIDHESGRVLEVNAAAEAMYGYSAEEFAQLTDLDLSAEPGRLARGPAAPPRARRSPCLSAGIGARTAASSRWRSPGVCSTCRGARCASPPSVTSASGWPTRRRCGAARSSTAPSSRRPRRASCSGPRRAGSPSSISGWRTCSATRSRISRARPAPTSPTRARSRR